MAVSLAQQQQSLPEIVQEFRDFIGRVVREYGKVIIGVDELDKLESDEQAQRFLNEIKAIFNLPNCFYLVSVSENAISNFERRGLSFRDAFDSAFDEILHVDYMTLNGSKSLLARRVLNLPTPFLCMCHCLSAGLPRDLIRVTRSALTFAEGNPQNNDIVGVAKFLVESDARAKVRATEMAAREIGLEPEVTIFLSNAAPRELFDPLSVGSLKDFLGPQLISRNDLTDEEKPLFRRLLKLQLELDAYLYFAATAAQTFAGLASDSEWQQAIDNGHIEALARARQAFELNAGIARFRVQEVRKSRGLPV